MNNVTLTAIMVALLATTQGASFLLRSWHNRLYRSFAFLCSAVFLANLGLIMAHVHDARAWHLVHLLGALLSGPAAVQFFLRLLGRPQPRGASLRPLLFPIGAALALLVIFIYDPAPAPDILSRGTAAYPDLFPAGSLVDRLTRAVYFRPATHVTYFLVGSYTFGCHLFILLNLLHRRKNTRHGVERARLTTLAWIGGLTLLANFAQSSEDYLQFPLSDYPIGGLSQLALIAFLSQVILLYRLLDLQEIVSKGLIFLAQVLTIGAFYSVLVRVFADRKSWLSLGFTLFLASGVVSLMHEPLRRLIESFVARAFFRRRYQLTARLHMLERDLPRILSADSLLDAMMAALTEVPRVTHAALFLWDERARDYSCERRAGPDTWPSTSTISAAAPFAQELLLRQKPFGYEDLERELDGVESRRVELSAALSTLRRLDAEVAIPFIGDGLLFGFLILKDDSMHEGFTHDELDLLQQLADRASVILQNSDAIQRLKERDRLAALGQMAAGLAHEIRNPLGAIRGAAQYLVDEIPDDTDREFLDIIVEEVDRLNKVVTEFLDYSRPLKTRLEAYDLNRLIAHVAHMLEAHGLPPGVELKLELDPDLPQVPVDVEKIKQVLLNLVQNAVQALSSEGTVTVQTGRAPRVAWTGARRGDPTLERIEVRVLDTGPGITPEHLEKLFIPFFTTKTGGTGLGLAISQRLVQAHGGELEVRSTLGQGTRFTVRLPLFEATPLPVTEEPVTPPVPAPERAHA